MEQKEISSEDYAASQYEHILAISKMNIDNEIRREDSLLAQASRMQTAFAFITAAIFAALPVCVDNRGALSYLFFYVWIAIIIFFMLASLVFASVAQWRFKTNAPGDIANIKETVLNDENWEEYINSSYRNAQIIELLIKLNDEKNTLNERRVKYIIISMGSFFLAILSICICFFQATCILWF